MTKIISEGKIDYLCRGFIVFEDEEYNKELYKSYITNKSNSPDDYQKSALQLMVKRIGEPLSVGKEGLIETINIKDIHEFTIYGLTIHLICLDDNRKIPGGITSPRGTHTTPPIFNTKISKLLDIIVEWSTNKINFITLESIAAAYPVYLHYGFIPFNNEIEFLNIITDKEINYNESVYFFRERLTHVQNERKSNIITDKFAKQVKQIMTDIKSKKLAKKWHKLTKKENHLKMQ